MKTGIAHCKSLKCLRLASFGGPSIDPGTRHREEWAHWKNTLGCREHPSLGLSFKTIQRVQCHRKRILRASCPEVRSTSNALFPYENHVPLNKKSPKINKKKLFKISGKGTPVRGGVVIFLLSCSAAKPDPFGVPLSRNSPLRAHLPLMP